MAASAARRSPSTSPVATARGTPRRGPAAASSRARSGPSPAISRRAPSSSRTAASATPRSFCAVRRPANASTGRRAGVELGCVGHARSRVRQQGDALGGDAPRDHEVAHERARAHDVRRACHRSVARRAQEPGERPAAARLEVAHLTRDEPAPAGPLERRIGGQLEHERCARQERAERRAPEHAGRIDHVRPAGPRGDQPQRSEMTEPGRQRARAPSAPGSPRGREQRRR